MNLALCEAFGSHNVYFSQILYSLKKNVRPHKKTTQVSALLLFRASISSKLSSPAIRSPRFCMPPWNKMSLKAKISLSN